VWQRLADIALTFRQYERAKRYIDKALTLDPANENILAWQQSYEEIVAQNRIQSAKGRLENDRDYNDNLRFRLIMNSVDFIMKYYFPLKGAPAGWLLSKAENVAPSNPFIPVLLARWHLANHDSAGAVSVVERAIPGHEDFIPLLEVAGEAYRKQKQKDKMNICFKQLIDLYHGHPHWREYLKTADGAV
jgi:tetratricopeptide (TPR) repeat protein